MSKPFEIKNEEHKINVIERLRKDLRALVVWEFENADEECFDISSKAFESLFDEEALECYYVERREYLDKINKKNYEKNMKVMYGEDWKEHAGEFKTE